MFVPPLPEKHKEIGRNAAFVELRAAELSGPQTKTAAKNL
jgi:hypothetical protein